MGLSLLLASAVSGCLARTFVHPLDTIRARLMVSTSKCSFNKVALDLMRSDGVRGLYRGFGISVCMQAPAVATFLTSYDWSKAAISTHTPLSSTSPATHLAAGLAAETVSAVFWVPMEVIKQRAQVRSGAHAASSIVVARSLLRHEGARGLFKGYALTVGVFGPYSMLYFMFYERFKATSAAFLTATATADTPASTFFTTQQPRPTTATAAQLPSPVIAACAGTAGAMAAACTTPLDVIKTRIQTQGDAQHQNAPAGHAYRSTWHAARTIASTEGTRGFFRGVSARVLWIVPSTAITMSTFEFLKAYFHLTPALTSGSSTK